MLHCQPTPWLLLGLSLAGAASGCQDPPAAAHWRPVAGRVTCDGQPVTRAQIRFENALGSVSVFANLEPDGTYALRRLDGDGLPPGEYRVAFTPLVDSPLPADQPPLAGAVPPPAGPPSHPQIAARYFDAATSGLSIVVQAGTAKPFDFQLQR